MKTLSLSAKVDTILSQLNYATIATVSADGQPWNTPVYAAFDNTKAIYWASWTENTHSRNIDANHRAFIVVYDSTVPEGAGQGAYFKGVARRLELDDVREIKKALRLLSKRSNMESVSPNPTKYLGDAPRRIYKMTPEKIWINDDGQVAGHYIDVRREVS